MTRHLAALVIFAVASPACATWPSRQYCDPYSGQSGQCIPSTGPPWRASPSQAAPRTFTPAPTACPLAGRWGQLDDDLVGLTARIAKLEAAAEDQREAVGEWNQALSVCRSDLARRHTEIDATIRETSDLFTRQLEEFQRSGGSSPAISGELATIDARLRALENRPAASATGGGGALPGLPLWQLLGAAGISGLVPGLGAALAGWQLARRARRDVRSIVTTISGLGASKPTPAECEGAASADPFRPDDAATIPRNADEAINFLRLSKGEGRSPLYDALSGRLTLDWLDHEIASDGPRKGEAQELKIWLLERINEMAPLATSERDAPARKP